MNTNKSNRHLNADSNKHRGEPPVDLENQFIMRFPPEPAKILRELLQSGAPLKDRLSIKLDNSDMRYGEVRFDHWFFHAKVVDLPTIVESLKTIDTKSFYKTADICQMLLCREEDDLSKDEDESTVQKKKKDPNKVDKKFLWPHGITPPIKNVRKKRFRKTLKKKYVEAPEIEKEVKRLLRVDNDAIRVKWEVICDDEDTTKTNKVITNSGTVKGQRDNNDGNNGNSSENVDVAEHDIFGEAVSDSEDDDDEPRINVEIDETSRLSADSRISDSNSMQVGYSERSRQDVNTNNSAELVTEFSRDMFQSQNTDNQNGSTNNEQKIPKVENPFHSEYMIPDNYCDAPTVPIQKDSIQITLDNLHAELADIRQQKQQQEISIENVENTTLRERIQSKLDYLTSLEVQKMQEIQNLEI